MDQRRHPWLRLCALAGLLSFAVSCATDTCSLLELHDGLFVEWSDGLSPVYDVSLRFSGVDVDLHCRASEGRTPELLGGSLGEAGLGDFDCEERWFRISSKPTFLDVTVADSQHIGSLSGNPVLHLRLVAEGDPSACDFDQYRPLLVRVDLDRISSGQDAGCP